MIDSGASPVDPVPCGGGEEFPLGESPPPPTAEEEEGALPGRARLRVLHAPPAANGCHPVGRTDAAAVGALETEAAAAESVTDQESTLRRLEMELAAARDEVEALHQMLEDLPEIFERKFRQRLQTVLDHQQHLLVDNRALRERLYALAPAAGSPAAVSKPVLPPALPAAAPSAAEETPPSPRRLHGRALRIRRAILRVLGRRPAS